jgi:NADPH-dependent glutamate synthase beta subunit-like oxidoreductase
MKELLAAGHDAVFVGSGAPRGKNLEIPGRYDTDDIFIGIDWLESVAFKHVTAIAPRVVIIGAGNTAMDCCRTAKRIGGKDIKVVARKPSHLLKASDWELEEAMEEKIELLYNLAPKSFVVENRRLRGVTFTRVEWYEDGQGKLRAREFEDHTIDCDAVLLAIGQENAFPYIERDIGIDFDKWEMPVVDKVTMQSTREGVFFGGDAAFGPKNIIWAVAHGHEAAISIHNWCHNTPVTQRLRHGLNLISQKMGYHEWSYSNNYDPLKRRVVPHVDLETRLSSLEIEVEEGFDIALAAKEAERCLNCDVQTVFTDDNCIECDACIDICPLNCLTITDNRPEVELRGALSAPAQNTEQALFLSGPLKQTARVMVKDEDLCIHCGLCAERCPTAAWDMQKSLIKIPYAGDHPCPA